MGEMLGSDSCPCDDDVSEDVVAEESPLQRCLLAAKILLGRAAADNIFADNEWQRSLTAVIIRGGVRGRSFI